MNLSHESVGFVAAVTLLAVFAGGILSMVGFFFYARSAQRHAKALHAHQRELQNLLLSTARSGKAAVDTRVFSATQDATREFENVPDKVLEQEVFRRVGQEAMAEPEPDRFDGLGGVVR